jgi:hypothetical protein
MTARTMSLPVSDDMPPSTPTGATAFSPIFPLGDGGSELRCIMMIAAAARRYLDYGTPPILHTGLDHTHAKAKPQNIECGVGAHGTRTSGGGPPAPQPRC